MKSNAGWGTLTPRDPHRIPRVLRELERVWTKAPDLRLCQLVENVAKKHGADHCIFGVQDDEFLEALAASGESR